MPEVAPRQTGSISHGGRAACTEGGHVGPTTGRGPAAPGNIHNLAAENRAFTRAVSRGVCAGRDRRPAPPPKFQMLTAAHCRPNHEPAGPPASTPRIAPAIHVAPIPIANAAHWR